MTVLKNLAALAVLLVGLCIAGVARAHEIRPAIVTATISADDRCEIVVSTNFEALLAGIGPQHKDTKDAPGAALYNELRALSPEALRARIEAFLPRWLAGIELAFDGKPVRPRVTTIDVPEVGDPGMARITTVVMTGEVPPRARTLSWRYAAEFGANVLRVRRAGEDELVTAWLKDGAASEPIPLSGGAPTSMVETFVVYLVLGFTHILPKGLDHILFVLGLYLLSTRLRPLLVQVTAFTVAHSITLALGLYGVVQVSPSIVEPLIAASIVYVAVENLVTSELHAWRPFVVFGFGLLHGLGFAGVLQEIGLPRADYVTGLIAFNFGVEFGQLAVIAIAFAAAGLWFRKEPWYRARIVQPASAVIALVGLVWTVERVMAG
jgi:hypothetical protein